MVNRMDINVVIAKAQTQILVMASIKAYSKYQLWIFILNYFTYIYSISYFY